MHYIGSVVVTWAERPRSRRLAKRKFCRESFSTGIMRELDESGSPWQWYKKVEGGGENAHMILPVSTFPYTHTRISSIKRISSNFYIPVLIKNLNSITSLSTRCLTTLLFTRRPILQATGISSQTVSPSPHEPPTMNSGRR